MLKATAAENVGREVQHLFPTFFGSRGQKVLKLKADRSYYIGSKEACIWSEFRPFVEA
jgi:hypothetical protein